MSNGNHVSIVGNLTREPELRFTPTGQATATFGVAVNRRWQNRQNGEWEESTSFIDVVCWGSLAENATQSLAKGARVLVTGRLDQRSWETPEHERRSKVEITADEIAPSLRWATVVIQKNERRGPEAGGGGQAAAPDDYPTSGATPASAVASNASNQAPRSQPQPVPAGATEATYNYEEEEPF
jgi:single-strand DNA-binding protein